MQSKIINKFFKNIPKEVKTISLYTSTLYFGRGFAEAYMPIFLFSFVDSYAQTGLLKSVYDIIFILAAPIAGYLSDRIPTRMVILVGLAFYPFISLSYLFAGITSISFFIILARVLNGISYALVSISRETHIYRSAGAKLAQSQGFFDSTTNWSRIVSVLISMSLVLWVPIHILFLAILPMALFAIYFARDLKQPTVRPKKIRFSFAIYKNIFKDLKKWNPQLRILMFLGVLITIMYTSFNFFVPIEVFQSNHNLQQIALMAIFFALPGALGSLFGHKVDLDHGRGFILSGIGIVIALTISLFVSQFWRYLVAIFIVGVAMEIIYLEKIKMLAVFGDKHSYGNINGVESTLNSIGAIIGPIAIGLSIDLGGLNIGFVIMIVLILLAVTIFNFSIMPAYKKTF